MTDDAVPDDTTSLDKGDEFYRAELYACTEEWLHPTITHLLEVEKAANPLSEDEHRRWRKRILEHVRVMRVSPNDVLVWRLPEEVLNDEEQMEQARAIAREFAEVCQRPVLILELGTDLTPEHLPQPQQQRPVIHVPRYLRP